MNAKAIIQPATYPLSSKGPANQQCLIRGAIVSDPIVVKSSASLSDILNRLRQIYHCETNGRETDGLADSLTPQNRLRQRQQLRSQASHIIVSQTHSHQPPSWIGYLTPQFILNRLCKTSLDSGTLTVKDFMQPISVTISAAACPAPPRLLEIFQTQATALILILDQEQTPIGFITPDSLKTHLDLQHLYTTIHQLQTNLDLVTQQQQQQEEQHRIQLESLDTRIKIALGKEEELNTFQNQFIAHAAHEFRTPLAVIASSAGILKDFGDRLDAAKKRTHLQRIQTYVNQTTQMLDQLLQVEQTLSQQISCELQSLDLSDWCHRLIDELKIATPERHITVSVDIVPPAAAWVNVDENLLRQILCNILSNAIKYSQENSIIQLSLQIREDVVVFKIQDEGMGIAESDQPFVFQPFYRSDDVSQITGTGLGLTIAKNCVTLHGGYISISSQPGQGSCVEIVIPNTQ
ncbi:MAG: HAMP domain-containing sensor histidine kinase [Cyanobacteria bacterium P01_A01_bin.114]